MNLATEYRKANNGYIDWIQKTNVAYGIIASHHVDHECLNQTDTGIAGMHLTQMALACVNNRSNIAQAAYTINTVVFNIRQQAIEYCYDHEQDIETFKFQDNTILQYHQNTWSWVTTNTDIQ